jgi:hypothetical protein
MAEPTAEAEKSGTPLIVRDDDGTLQKSQYRRRYLAYGISRRFSRESVLFMEGTIEDSDEADGGSLRNSLIGIGGYYTF